MPYKYNNLKGSVKCSVYVIFRNGVPDECEFYATTSLEPTKVVKFEDTQNDEPEFCASYNNTSVFVYPENLKKTWIENFDGQRTTKYKPNLTIGYKFYRKLRK